MAKGKRKKYPKLPNGYGSIKYLGKNRRNPYAVHPPTEEFNEDGIPQTPKALCYVNDWMVGFAVLTAHKAGTYYKGMEIELRPLQVDDDTNINTLAARILADYNQTKSLPPEEISPTFKDIYEMFWKYKYETEKGKNLSAASKRCTSSAFMNCAALHDKEFKLLKLPDLQAVVDNCTLKHASLELIVSLIKQMYIYAEIYELCDKNYGKHVKINKNDDDIHGIPFTESELKTLWAHKDNEIIEFILIMCYSGYRIQAYKSLKIDLQNNYFQGGVKTKAGKDRIVPIHSSIYNLVDKRIKKQGAILPESIEHYRTNMYKALMQIGIPKHTPHDCRHTFSMLCEKYGVNENDRKRMLGHSFGEDITNAVYGHRTLDDLRKEIEKIQVCY